MAYTKAYTEMSRRDHGMGSLFQRCEARYECPPLVDGERPRHKCEGRWYGSVEAGFNANGTRRRITVSGKSKTIVLRKLQAKLAERQAEGRSGAKRTVTVAKWSATWLVAIQSKVRPSAYETDKAAMRWVVKTIGHVKIADLTPAHVRSVRMAITNEGLSTSTALRYHGSLIRLLKAAALEGYNVAPNVLLTEPPKKAVNDRRSLPFVETLRVLNHITRTDEHGALLMPDSSRWSLAILQGIRQAEALGLTWDQVDLDAETVTISWQLKSLRYRDRENPSAGFAMPDGYEARQLVGATHLVRPKSVAGWRVQPLVPWTVTALRAWKEVAPPHELVWPGRTIKGVTWPRNPASDRSQWEAIQKALTISHPSGRPYAVHEIRHGTATLLMELKVPESVRIAIMGHSSIATTHGYEHVDLSQARVALERMAERLQLNGG